jgi:hypothetical protein
MRNGILLAAIAAVAISGCATAPSADEEARADYGEMPTDFQTPIKAYLDQNLKDPASVQLRNWTIPVKSWIRDAPIAGRALHFGWVVNVDVNAKNSYGGYRGFQTYQFMLHGNMIVNEVTPQDLVN